MKAVVFVAGEGLLADLICTQLATHCQVVRSDDWETGAAEADVALVLHDAWQPSVHLEAEKVFSSLGIPWLRAFVAFGEAVIGPLVRPGQPGCSRCADIRMLMAGRDRKEMWALRNKMMEYSGAQHDPWGSRTGLQHATHLVIAEVNRVTAGSQAHLEERMQLIDLKSLSMTRHFFLPDPACPLCSQMPEDTSRGAHIELRPSPKISPFSFRTRSMDELKHVLTAQYLDTRTGLLNGKTRDLVSPLADVSVNLPLYSHDEGTAGRTNSYADSELTAILEGLERYCGLAPRGKRTVVYDSYANVAAYALDPTKAGVHTREQYALPDYPFQPFDPNRPMNWVWGYSFQQQRPILVPELLAYYSMGHGEGFVFETSNGCALGGSLEEAIFYGMLEVVERDAFLLTWYAQLPLPRLDPRSIEDTELLLMIDRLEAVSSYEIQLYNATMENGIPSVWTLAKNKEQKGLAVVCAAGAHLDPVRAVKSSIHEVSTMLLTLTNKLEANREKYIKMLHDPTRVRKMDDHSMLYGLPEAMERLHFLLDDSRPLHSFAEQFDRSNQHADLTDDLRQMIRTFTDLNMDVIVVDQTTSDVRRNGLHCARVLIPGMLPMTFGYHLSRLTGLDRVLRVPAQLGYVQRPLSFHELNPHPHPFP